MATIRPSEPVEHYAALRELFANDGILPFVKSTFVFVSSPRLAWRRSLCPPTQREVYQFSGGCVIFIDWMVEAGNHWRLAA